MLSERTSGAGPFETVEWRKTSLAAACQCAGLLQDMAANLQDKAAPATLGPA